MRRTIILLLATIAIVACENDPITPNEPETVNEETQEEIQQPVLKQIRRTKADTIDPCPVKIAEFDTRGRIIEINRECTDGDVTARVYSYHENGLIRAFTHHYDFTYDENDFLIRRSGGNDTGSGYIDFTYDNNLMIAQAYYNGEPGTNFFVYEFEDASLKKLISQKTIDPSNDDEIIYRVTYQYEGHNPVDILYEQKNTQTQILEPIFRITISYDDKINPYKSGLPDNAYLINETMQMDLGDWPYNLVFGADNNFTNVTTFNFINDTSFSYTKSYTYNDLMYPIEAEVLIGNREHHETYEYYE